MTAIKNCAFGQPIPAQDQRSLGEEIASSAADAARLRAALIKYVRKTRTDTDRAGRFMGLKMTIDRRALDAASDDLNTTLRPEFGAIDGMDTAAQLVKAEL